MNALGIALKWGRRLGIAAVSFPLISCESTAAGTSTNAAAQLSAVGRPAQRAVRDLLIADKDDDWSFQQLFAMTVDRHGNIYAWDSEDYRIRAFDQSGKRLRLIGRKGQGPGELSQLGNLTVTNDTLWVSEAFSSRITAFALKTSGYRTATVALKSGGTVSTRLSSGFLVGERTNSVGGDGFRYSVVDRSGSSPKTIIPFIRIPKLFQYDVVQENVKGGPVVGRQVVLQPVLLQSSLHVFPDGTGILVIGVDDTARDGPFITMRAVAANGGLLWESRTPFNTIAFTDEDFRKAVDDFIAPTVVKNMRIVGSRKMILDSLVRPRSWPAFTKVVLGIDQTIWLKAGSPTSTDAIFWQFSAKGAFVRAVRVPDNVRVLAASQTHLWTTRRDANGIPIIERYAVR